MLLSAGEEKYGISLKTNKIKKQTKWLSPEKSNMNDKSTRKHTLKGKV